MTQRYLSGFCPDRRTTAGSHNQETLYAGLLGRSTRFEVVHPRHNLYGDLFFDDLGDALVPCGSTSSFILTDILVKFAVTSQIAEVELATQMCTERCAITDLPAFVLAV